MSLPDYLAEITTYLANEDLPESPEAVIILGSGLGHFVDEMQNSTSIPYSSIPHFPVTSVKGHEGALTSGTVNGHSVIAFSGRFHHYEGFSFEQTVLPVYLAKALDARKLIISNAAGAINPSFSVGDLMVIEDIIRHNLSISPKGHPRFRYTHYPHVNRIRKMAAELQIDVRQGTYCYVKGPNYETRAEIRAFRRMGADTVGMSTAPELMEAARLGLKTAAVSLISNMAAGMNDGKLNHDKIADVAELRKEDFARLVKKIIAKL